MMNLPENELFSAYLDGELTADEQAKVEQLLATSPAARQLVDELRALSTALQSLPVQRLEGELSNWVLRQAERRVLGDYPDRRPRPRGTSEGPAGRGEGSLLRRFLRPRTFLWSALAVAVAVALTLQERGADPPREVAVAPPNPAPKAPPSIQAWEEPVLPAEGGEPGLPGVDEAVVEPAVSSVTPRMAAESPPATPSAPPVEDVPMPEPAAIAAEEPAAPVVAEGPVRETEKPAADRAQPARPAAGVAEQPAPEQPIVEEPVREQHDASPAALAESVPPATSAQPAPVATEPAEELPAEQTPEAPDVLVVYCDVSPEVFRQKLFEQILVERKLSVVDAWESEGGAEAADHRKASAATKVYRVEVTAEQLAKVMNELRSRPEAYLSIKTEANRPVGGTAIQGVRIGTNPLSGGVTVRLGPGASSSGNLGADATTGAVSTSPSAAAQPGVGPPKARGGVTFRGNIGVRPPPAKPGEAVQPSAEKAAEPAAKPAAPKPLRVRFVLRAAEAEPPAAGEPAESAAETPAADQS